MVVHTLAGVKWPHCVIPNVSEGGTEDAVRSTRVPAERVAEALTRREREVAALVAQGHSTRTIAADLIIAERTVARHIESIFNKLGFHSRAQIAAWAVQHGLLAGDAG